MPDCNSPKEDLTGIFDWGDRLFNLIRLFLAYVVYTNESIFYSY